MHFVINKNDFAKVLGRAASAASAKSPIAALCCVLFDVKDGALTARATDTMVGVECSTTVDVKAEGCIAVADAKRAFAVVKGLPSGDVTVKLVKGNVEISAKKAKFKLDSLPAEDFPVMPVLGGASVFQVAAHELSRLISQGAYALAQGEDRPHLNGALFDYEDGVLTCVSTDGHRLAKSHAEMVVGFQKMLLAPRALGELSRACDSVGAGNIGVAVAGTTAFFVADGFTLSVKCRDDVFPPYKSLKVVPDKALALNAAVLSDAIKRVSTMAKKESGQVVISFRDGALRISTQDGSGEDSIECACDFEFQSAVNWAYLDQAINAMTCDEVMFNLADRLDPIMLTPVGAKDCSALVMPMRT